MNKTNCSCLTWARLMCSKYLAKEIFFLSEVLGQAWMLTEVLPVLTLEGLSATV